MVPVVRRPAVRRLVILGAAVAGAALAASPTGVTAVDLLWSAAFAAALAYAGAYASTLVLLPAAGGAALLSSTGPGLGLAAAAVAVAVVGSSQDRPSSRITAAAGGFIALALLTRGDGSTLSLIAGDAIVAAAVLASGWQGMTRRRRRQVTWVLAGTGAVLLVFALAGALAGLRARAHVDDGIDALRAARRSATAGDIDTAVAGFRTAERAFLDAAAPLQSYGRLARIVPGVSQQVDAATVAVETAADASTALRQAGVSLNLHDVGVRQGAIDLAVVREAEAPLGTAVHALVDTVRRLSAVDLGPLVPPVRDALVDALDEARAAATTAERAHRTVQELPSLLGGDRPTRYLVLFTSPVEARNRFGFPGAYAVLRFEAGRLAFERSGPIGDIDPTAVEQALLDIPQRVVPYVGYGAARNWRSITLPADGPSVAEMAVQLGARSGLGQLDGLVMADPAALAAIIGLVGDVPLPERDLVLTEANTVDYLNRLQYLEFATDNELRKDVLVEVAAVVGARLGSLSLPSVQGLATRFGGVVEQGHLVVGVPTAARPGAADLFRDLHLDGGFQAPQGAELFHVGQRNRVGNKIDLFLHRSLSYDVAIAKDGSLTAELTVELVNQAPASGLPGYVIGSALPAPRPPTGTNLTTTLIYSPHQLHSISVDGVEVVPAVLVDGQMLVYQVEVDLAPGQRRTIHGVLEGAAAPGPYELQILPNGLVEPDRFTTTLDDARRGDRRNRTVEEVRGPHCLARSPRPRC